MKKLYFFLIALVAMMMCPAGVWAQSDAEALWGSDVNQLTTSGTFDEAIEAVNAGEAGYVQLQKDIMISRVYMLIGEHACTLDLNSYTTTTWFHIEQGFALTIVDSSEEQTGMLSSNAGGSPAIDIYSGGTLNLYSGKIYHENMMTIYQNSGENTTVNIYGGTVESGGSAAIHNKENNSLNITGGKFVGGSYELFNIEGAVTVKGGEMVYDETDGYSSVFYMLPTASLDLSEYPTTATEGVTPLEKIIIYSSGVISAAEVIVLPEGYCVMNQAGEKVNELVNDYYHIGPTPAPEVRWGSDKDNLTSEGSLEEALDAANAGEAGYIQLQKDIMISQVYMLTGEHACTLDLNGDTTMTRFLIEEGFALTIVDSSEEQTGMLSSNAGGTPTIYIYSGGTLNLYSGKIYHESMMTIYQNPDENTTVNIYGGTVESGGTAAVHNKKNNSLNITGGKFISGSYEVLSIEGAVTVKGGEMVYDETEDYSSVFYMLPTASLDLSEYPTTATEGVTPLEKIIIYISGVINATEFIVLPEGYCVMNQAGEKVNELANDFYHIGPTPAPEARWGSNKDNLTSEGSLKEALDAANAGEAGYIQLQKDIMISQVYMLTGEHACTLDLNGDTTMTRFLIEEGFALTIVDSSEEQTGMLSSNAGGTPAIDIYSGGTLNLYSGKIYHESMMTIYQNSDENTTVNIYGGTVESGRTAAIHNKENNSLNITGGKFISGSYELLSIEGAVTVKGGEMVYDETEDYSSVFYMLPTASLDLSEYPTTATEGVTPLEEIIIYISGVISAAEVIVLPEGYCVMNQAGERVNELAHDYYHIGPTPAPEARWGSNKDNLTSEGSLRGALDAANAGEAGYIQLLKNVDYSDEFFPSLYGSHACTLDLNGDTIMAAFSIRDGFALTIVDSSEEQTGMVGSNLRGTPTIDIFSGGTLNLYSGKIYHENMMTIYQNSDSITTVNIYGGTLETNQSALIHTERGGLVDIKGGKFATRGRNHFHINDGDFAMSGGEIVYLNTPNMPYQFILFNMAILNLSEYPTTSLESMMPLEEMVVYVADYRVAAETVYLPEGYSVLSDQGVLMEELESGYYYYIGRTPVISAVENIQAAEGESRKILRDGQLIILRDGKEYNAMGQRL